MGIRILIKAIQKIGGIYEKALTPIYSYFKDHYYRIYFEVEKGKQKVDIVLKQHKYINYDDKTCEFTITYTEKIGPLWTGTLKENKLAKKIAKQVNNKFTEQIEKESDDLFFYDLHEISKRYKLPLIKTEKFLTKLKATRTHFNLHAIKTKHSIVDVLKIFNKD